MFPAVPSDEELRRVAEDLRALARSLARDLHEASRSARSGGRFASDTFRQEVRRAAYDATQEFKRGFNRHFEGHPWLGGPPWPSRPPGAGGPSSAGAAPRAGRPGRWAPPGPGAAGTTPPAGVPPTGPPRGFGPRPHHCRRSGPPPVRRHWDAAVVALMLAAVLGAGWLASTTGLLAVRAEPVLAVALLLLGAAIVVTARTDWSLSRRAWPLVAGVVLVVGLFATSATYGLGGALTHLSVGHRTVHPTSTGTVYGGIGGLTVDAGGAGPGAVIDVRAVAGSTVIDPPAGPYTVSGQVLVGSVCLDGRRANGVGASTSATPRGGTPPVAIDVHQLAGTISIAGLPCGRP
jgi:hypothetical protein